MARAAGARPASLQQPAPTPPAPATSPLVFTERMHEAAAAVAQFWLGAGKPGGDEDRSQRLGEALDRSAHFVASRLTLGLAPTALAGAYLDWLMHLETSPGKQLQLAEKAIRKWARLARYTATCALRGEAECCIEPLAQDDRFRTPAWRQWPFNVLHQAFLLQQQWWHVATTGIRGVGEKHEAQVNFASRQLLDIVSPSNFVATNPDVLERTLSEGGMNLVRGWWNLVEDWERTINGRPPPGAEAYEVGRNLALSPGRVIWRNELMELIQYAPATDEVRPEPVLIVPAWIMKYYVLDLTPEASLVGHLRQQGFTVFLISWKNPGYEDRDLGMEDYRRLGVMEALSEVRRRMPGRKVHGVGYCLGGTLLSIAAAALARDGDEALASLSFLAAQVDFEEAGELTLFMVEAQVAFLEDMMRQQGYLDQHQMAGAFQMLRSNDLVWSRVIRHYLIGEREPMNALMAWNADGTRMPARMHSEYLRQLFLRNDLAEGRLTADGRHVALTDIRQPVFAVGTETDHVAPWRSVYKFHLLLDTSVTFLLTNGGHNGGIVSPPGRKGRRFRLRTKNETDRYLDPGTWFATTRAEEGSWWPAWTAWLAERSGTPVAAPGSGEEAGDFGPAPGIYVRQR